MPRPRRQQEWDTAIKMMMVEKPRPGPLRMQTRLKEAFKLMGKPAELAPVPARKTIQRRIEEFGRDPEALERYRRFHWPEAMGAVLPWEAGPAALELARWNRERGFGPPLIALVRWFWRVTELAPEAPLQERYVAASQLTTVEVADAVPENEAIRRSVELWLAFAPWRSETDAEAYHRVLKQTKIAAFSAHRTLRVSGESLADVLSVITGQGISRSTARALADYLTGVTESPSGFEKVTPKKGASK